ncbi:uncharacterized protein LOC106754162 isoform X2 [Vigna radiata var. radiata]|uniref:Uncharacterized protein LOC106754162 isoform X2 n=1 Tax=Vigna radiata var. radiata TaxID=3916 RepID=A0A1S3TCZ8_VIGRR|nr:uncharacterized protein LOC106754162 isoform X2 [Vigna radiata var. radiata]
MRCFLPCFRTSKRRNQLRSLTQTHVGEGAVEPLARQKTDVEELIDCIAESKIRNAEQSNNNSVETKEERDKGATAGEAPQIDEKKNDHERDDEISERLHQEESSESLFSLSVCSRKKVSDAETVEPEVNSPIQLVCTREVPEAFGSSPNAPLQNISSVLSPVEEFTHENPSKEKDDKEGENGKVTHPVLQYRYRDCPDDEYDDVNLDTSDLDSTLENDDPQSEKRKRGEEGGVVKRTWVQEESSESLFSLSADSRIRISSAEAENEVDSLVSANITQKEAQGRIPDVSSVLNPIENVTKERVVKAREVHPLKMDKENINLVVQDGNIPVSSEPALKLSNRKGRQFSDSKRRQEIGVDTSLSSWLVESESTPISINSNSCVGEHTPKGRRGSPWSHEDRPILGALTVEEIRMYSLSASSIRSRSRSPDETPIIGTVGSYWTHTEQSMDLQFNKKGKDVSPKRTTMSLQTRLEGAFDASVSMGSS